ncbi:DMP19 family protein [Sphingomonas abaci]|uniref:DNA mimic protein DMP19 C-terminal domain-containing protein n=1 Tax=Sphingomonas abaci TaxID=237611 RepID=A0A7W7EXI5_9SPHN|nr:DUF4375 domain-containing protein [Sphingomonas abaci]MBB4617657.1 hypothetical protein [Sphingomonas abaci]
MPTGTELPSTPQLFVPNILVLRCDFQDLDPTVLPNAVISFCNWCIHEADLPSECVQPDAWLLYCTSFYVGQVCNGGHGQFAGNSGMDHAFLAEVDAGLEAFGLNELRENFDQFVGIMLADQALHDKVVDGCGFGDIPSVIETLDDKFLDLFDVDQFSRRASEWLRCNPHVLALTPAEKWAEEKKIIAQTGGTSGPPAHPATKTGDFWTGYFDTRPPITTRDDFEAEAARLRKAFEVAMLEDDENGIDAVIAGYRALQDACPPDNRQRWSKQVLHLKSQLLLAGERWGRTDLLDQAADAIRQSIAEDGDKAEGPNAAFAWRALGEALVGLAQINPARISAMPEALAAFDRSIAIEEASAGGRDIGAAGENWIGKAEAMILLAKEEDYAARLSMARALLDEAPKLQTMAGPARMAAARADLLLMSPYDDITEAVKRRTRHMLDDAIACERDNDGAIWSSPFRLKRLQHLRAHPRLAAADDTLSM